MKITIVYFSGTGNTWYVAQEIKTSLQNKGVDAQCYSIENPIFEDDQNLESLITTADNIIFGFPTYASDVPWPMQKFFKRLPQLNSSKDTAVFCTQAFGSGDGALIADKYLKDKGYFIKQTAHFNMSNNFYVPVFIRVFPVGDQEKIRKRNAKATEKVQKFAAKIVSGEQSIIGDNFFGHLIGNVQRGHFDALIKKINNLLIVDHSLCTNCNQCLKFCPEQNITENDSKITINDNCCSCMRCYQLCPVLAINITNKTTDAKKYPRFKGPTKSFKISELTK